MTDILYFTGENITAMEANRKVAKGILTPVYRGAFVDTAECEKRGGIQRVVLDHLPRIVAKNYPDANLACSSAFYRGPSGRTIYIGGNYKRKAVRTPYFDIVQLVSPTKTGLFHSHVMMTDSMGDFRMMAARDELVFMQMFDDYRSNLGCKIKPTEIRQLALSLLEKHGGAKLMELMEYMAQETGRSPAVAHKIHDYLTHFASDTIQLSSVPRNQCSLGVYWNQRHVANLVHDGMDWKFSYTNGWMLPISFANHRRLNGQMPPFVKSLMPEGWMKDRLPERGEIDVAASGLRYLSNIVISSDPSKIKDVPIDYLSAKLSNHSVGGVFSGALDNMPDADLFIDELGSLWGESKMPRLSGIQIKIPMNLRADGSLVPAMDSAFTHILKLPGMNGDYVGLGAVEWLCMDVARRAGLKTSEASLLFLPHLPPSLVVERWDIKSSQKDPRLLLAEDFCSVLERSPEDKYGEDLNVVAAKIGEWSTSVNADIDHLTRQALTCWIIGNGDFHLKNLSFLKEVKPMLDSFEEVRLSPAYDLLCTKAFSNLASSNKMSLSMNGKFKDYTLDDFVAFASRHCDGLDTAKYRQSLEEFCDRIVRAAVKVTATLPEQFNEDVNIVAKQCVYTAANEMVVRAAQMLGKDPRMMVQQIRDETISRKIPKKAV